MDSSYEKRGYLLEDFRLFHLCDPQGVQTDYHYHEFCKLLLLVSGSGGYNVEGRHYRLGPGDLVLLNSRCVHRPELEPGMPYERIILYISPGFLQRESSEDFPLEACFSPAGGHVLHLPEAQRQCLLRLTGELERVLSRKEPGWEILGKSALLRLLVELGRFQQQENVQYPQPLHPNDRTVASILSYLDGHLTEELTIDRLAEEFYLSKYHMMRRFRQETGMTIHSYLQERRLFLARELLTAGLPATEACYQAGFGSYSAFARSYTRLFGCTPSGKAVSPPEEGPYE